MGLLIDLWKVTKVVEIKVDRENLIGGVIPKLTFVDQPSYVESSTNEYDRISIFLSIYSSIIHLSVYPFIHLSVYLVGIQVSGLGTISPLYWIWSALFTLSKTQRMVLICPLNVIWFPLNLWLVM